MKRLLATAAVVLALFALPSTASATSSVTCNYKASEHSLTVDTTGGYVGTLSRDVAGVISITGASCGGATVNNVDGIVIKGDDSNQEITIDLANKGFKPGFTNEPGSSDEIEFNVNLRGSAFDKLIIKGTDAAEHIDMGKFTSALGDIQEINLNSSESTGVDWDVAMTNVESIWVYGNGGNDVIRARGKKGTGPDPLSIPLHAFGGAGNDVIKGGEASDTLQGDTGTDTLYGFGGPDDINMNDGAGGDVGYGGADVDSVIYDGGDTWHPN